MNSHSKALQNLLWISQLGVSLITPPLVCIWGAYWLQNHFSLGGWIMILGIILGFGAAASSGMAFYRMVLRQAKKKEEKHGKSFNSHE